VKIAYKYNSEGKYIEPVTIQPNVFGMYTLPENHTFKMLPQPNWKCVFNEELDEWVETITQEEIDAIKNAPREPTELELLTKQQADLTFELMMKEVL
jgi:hypothetical protein